MTRDESDRDSLAPAGIPDSITNVRVDANAVQTGRVGASASRS